MDNNDLKERDFEAYIEHWLTTEGGYTKGNQATYDKERAIDLKTLIRFLQLTQEKNGNCMKRNTVHRRKTVCTTCFRTRFMSGA